LPTETFESFTRLDIRASGRPRGLLARGLIFGWKYLIGTVLCLHPVGSVLVLGWTLRLSQRSIFKHWWKRSPRRESLPFSGLLAFREHTHWPNWIVHQNLVGELSRVFRERRGFRATFGAAAWTLIDSAWLNLRIGALACWNTSLFTLPGCLLWLFAWYDGWNNSFHKGYEQAAVGPLLGLAGVAAFIAAMFYVPLAQVRHASTGSWRSFYDFRFIVRLVRQRWLDCLGLALLYSLLSIPLTVLKVVPALLPQINPALEELSDSGVRSFLNWYYFASCGFVFPCFVVLRLAAARIYARAIISGIESNQISPAELGLQEHQALTELQLLRELNWPKRHLILRAVTGTLRLGRFAVPVLIALVWFTFVSQIFISEFMNYHPVTGWLNQPLVQLPWFRY
jgi:hypothetical protein